MNEVSYTQDSLTITNTCPDCIAQEMLCVDCVELADARLTDKAYELVDEGNLQYKRPWLIERPQPSASDWTESETVSKIERNKDGEIVTVTYRHEFLTPIVQINDGGEVDNLWELDDETQRRREVECHWCHILTPKIFNDCQSCDKPLETNVR
jgi:hypothetical protein